MQMNAAKVATHMKIIRFGKPMLPKLEELEMVQMEKPFGQILCCYARAYQKAIHRCGLTPVHTAESPAL